MPPTPPRGHLKPVALEDITIAGAKAILINITANEDLLFEEFNDASAYINDALGEADTNIIIGCATDESAGDEIRVTVIATGIEGSAAPKAVQGQANVASIRTQPQRPVQQAQPAAAPHPGLNYQKPGLMEERPVSRMRMPRPVGNFSEEEAHHPHDPAGSRAAGQAVQPRPRPGRVHL
ncbi:MAG: hypothetical protein V8Q84_02510 [Bilophila sp.]